MNPKAYTGKRAWWYNYQYFPELKIFGQSTDTIPDLQHKISLWAGAGLAGFSLEQNNIHIDGKWGMTFGARYNYYFTNNWAMRTGFSFAYAQSDGSMGYFTDSFTKTDQESDEVIYNYDLASLVENYDIYMLDVPIQLVYTWRRLDFGLGIKVAYPVAVAYTQSLDDVHTQAYFPQYDALITDSWVMGCGEYAEIKGDNKYLSAPLLFMGTFDVEYELPIGSKYSVGIGAFVDYSLSDFAFRHRQLDNLHTEQNTIVGTSDEAPIFLQNASMLSSKRNFESENVVRHMKYLNAGIKLSFNMNWYGPPKPKTKPY